MKKNKNNSLFFVLLRDYVLFTLVLILIGVGAYFIWQHQVNSMFSGRTLMNLPSVKDFKEGRYDHIKPEDYLGKGGALAVFDETGKMIYSSAKGFDESITLGELECIADYDRNYYIDYLQYVNEKGKEIILVTKTEYSEDWDKENTQIMILDENYNILSGGFEPKRTAYTEKEFKYLTGTWSNKYFYYKYKFNDESGNGKILIARYAEFSQEDYDNAINRANRLLILILPLYIIIAALFIIWMDRRIRIPLEKLDTAIIEFGEGQPIKQNEWEGPREIRRLGENFALLAQKLEKTENEKKHLEDIRQKLITDISHDLKTPITIISGYTSAILDKKIQIEELDRYLHVIDVKVRALTDLINKFHEYSQTEHPDFKINDSPQNLSEFLREYLATKYDEIDLAGFSLRVNITENQVLCNLDQFQFRRALDNILFNSLKHNTLGTQICIRLSIADNNAVIRFMDNGRGIPKELRKNIFDAFVVGEQSRTGAGSGLGLSISKRIIELHGGKILLADSSSVYYQTEFQIILPLIKAEE